MTPFTFDQALDIAVDFDDLKETHVKVTQDTTLVIEDIVVCPFPAADRDAFVAAIAANAPSAQALQNYSGAEYDVIVFATELSDRSKYTVIPIRVFTEAKGIRYNYPEQEL